MRKCLASVENDQKPNIFLSGIFLIHDKVYVSFSVWYDLCYFSKVCTVLEVLELFTKLNLKNLKKSLNPIVMILP